MPIIRPDVVGITPSNVVATRTASIPAGASWTYTYTPGTEVIPASGSTTCPSNVLVPVINQSVINVNSQNYQTAYSN